MEFLRQEYWKVLPFPSPGDFPDPEIKPTSPALQADSLPLSTMKTVFPMSHFGVNVLLNFIHKTENTKLFTQIIVTLEKMSDCTLKFLYE